MRDHGARRPRYRCRVPPAASQSSSKSLPARDSEVASGRGRGGAAKSRVTRPKLARNPFDQPRGRTGSIRVFPPGRRRTRTFCPGAANPRGSRTASLFPERNTVVSWVRFAMYIRYIHLAGNARLCSPNRAGPAWCRFSSRSRRNVRSRLRVDAGIWRWRLRTPLRSPPDCPESNHDLEEDHSGEHHRPIGEQLLRPWHDRQEGSRRGERT